MKGDRNGVWSGGIETVGPGKSVRYGERGLFLAGDEGASFYSAPGFYPSMA
jgi:hypothetical protein